MITSKNFLHCIWNPISLHWNTFFVDYLYHLSPPKLELIKVKVTKTSIQFHRAPKSQDFVLPLWVQESMRKVSDNFLLVACVCLAIHNPLLLSDQEPAFRQWLPRAPWCHQIKRKAVWTSSSWSLHPENLESAGSSRELTKAEQRAEDETYFRGACLCKCLSPFPRIGFLCTHAALFHKLLRNILLAHCVTVTACV